MSPGDELLPGGRPLLPGDLGVTCHRCVIFPRPETYLGPDDPPARFVPTGTFCTVVSVSPGRSSRMVMVLAASGALGWLNVMSVLYVNH